MKSLLRCTFLLFVVLVTKVTGHELLRGAQQPKKLQRDAIHRTLKMKMGSKRGDSLKTTAGDTTLGVPAPGHTDVDEMVVVSGGDGGDGVTMGMPAPGFSGVDEMIVVNGTDSGESCPVVDPAWSCMYLIEPVLCDGRCEYVNECTANGSGWQSADCVPVN